VPSWNLLSKYGDSFFVKFSEFCDFGTFGSKTSFVSFALDFFWGCKMEQIYPQKITHWTNLTTEVWALITFKEVGLGTKKNPHHATMPHEKTLWNSTLSNGMMQRNNNTILIFVLPTHFVSTKIETPLTLKFGDVWDGPPAILPY